MRRAIGWKQKKFSFIISRHARGFEILSVRAQKQFVMTRETNRAFHPPGSSEKYWALSSFSNFGLRIKRSRSPTSNFPRPFRDLCIRLFDILRRLYPRSFCYQIFHFASNSRIFTPLRSNLRVRWMAKSWHQTIFWRNYHSRSKCVGLGCMNTSWKLVWMNRCVLPQFSISQTICLQWNFYATPWRCVLQK